MNTTIYGKLWEKKVLCMCVTATYVHVTAWHSDGSNTQKTCNGMQKKKKSVSAHKKKQ